MSSHLVRLSLARNPSCIGSDGAHILTMEHIHSIKLDLMVLAIWSSEGLLSHHPLAVLLGDRLRDLHLWRLSDFFMRIDTTVTHSRAA